jgi:hypothetical protein
MPLNFMRLLQIGLLFWACFSAIAGDAEKPYGVLLSIPSKPQMSALSRPPLKAEGWGYVDLEGRVIVPPVWDNAWPFYHGYAIIFKGKQMGLVDAMGKVVVKPEWDQIICELTNGRHAVKKDGKCHVVDASGNNIGPLPWDDMAVEDPCEGLRRVWRNKKVGFADADGKVVIEPTWDAACNFADGLAKVVKDKKEGFISHSGKLQVDLDWDDNDASNRFSEGLANVKSDGKWGFIDKTGKAVIPVRWDRALSPFSDGLALVAKDYKWGFIDQSGREVVPLKWDHAYLFSEGLAMVELNNKRGYVDATGKVVIEPQWPTATSFSEGRAAVEINGKCGFIDTSGKVVIPPQWDLRGLLSDEANFRVGRAKVRKDGHLGLIDATGKVIVAPEWDTMDRQPPYYNGGCFVTRYADHGLKTQSDTERLSRLNGVDTPERETIRKSWEGYQPAEAAWFDRDGKMIWHSWQ